ncbi:unnamed protein product [Callosobruchus maculatus]|uniref:DUF4780 domain-containing protein n=1 Tax=Callosobruchus maculatus TaxID=64391 RepID=A0A653CVA7_CALMS|nr:unnamed protein product [Callosobruchus maculatus]
MDKKTANQPKPQHEMAAHGSQPSTSEEGCKRTRRGKRISGAEAKRRRKAREASATAASSQFAPPSVYHRQTPVRGVGAVHPQGAHPSLKKRFRFDAPSPQRVVKRPRPAQATNYRESATNHLKVAVIDNCNPLGKIPAEKERLLKRALLEELDTIVLSRRASERPPVFRSWKYVGEIIKIVCEDEDTLEWLKETIFTIRPWEDADLDVVRADQLPRLTKATLWIPVEADHPLEEVDLVVRRLDGHNPQVAIRSWSIFHHEVTNNTRGCGHLLVFGIGNRDLETLRENAMKLNYQFQSLYLKVKEVKENGVSDTTLTAAVGAATNSSSPRVKVEKDFDAVSPLSEEGRPLY